MRPLDLSHETLKAQASHNTPGRLDRFMLPAILGWAALIRLGPLLFQIGRFGSIVRYHSGGLFWAFIEAIRANHFALPTTIPNYTNGGLPFAYPPLGFYIAAIIRQITGINSILLLILSAVISFLAVVAFSDVIRRTSLPRTGQYVALIAFATWPKSVMEQAVGQGYAESLGLLLLVLFYREMLSFDAAPSWYRSVRLGVLLGLNVLSAPGTALAAPLTLILYFMVALITGRGSISRATRIGYAVGAISASLVIASPYLLHVSTHYGLGLLFDATQGQVSDTGRTISRVAKALFYPYKDIPNIPFWNILAGLGMVAAARRKEYFMLLWTLLLAAIPREGSWMVLIPLAVLAGYGTMYILLPAFERINAFRWTHGGINLTLGGLLLTCIVFYTAMVVPGWLLARPEAAFNESYVTEGEARYLESLHQSSPPNTVILLAGDENEWAPVLSQRTVLNVRFGTEWVPRKDAALWDIKQKMQKARSANDLLAAIQTMQAEFPDYLPIPDLIYFSKVDRYDRETTSINPRLISDLRKSPCFEIRFEDESVLVFAPTGQCSRATIEVSGQAQTH